MLNPNVKDAGPLVSYAYGMDTMGTRIRQLRIARGFTQEQFGELVGVTKSAVSQWEDDSTKNLKLTTFLKVLSVLRTDANYLIFGESRGPGDTGTRRSLKLKGG